MDVLKNKQTKSYDYISRYATFPYYYNTVDNKYIYGLTGQLGDSVTYVAHEVKQKDTLDSLALKYYGRPDLYWIIADFNKIQDPFIDLFSNYQILKVPSISAIYFE